MVESETCLGVTTMNGSITDKFLIEQVRKASVRLEMLKRIVLNARLYGPRLSTDMYLKFICPKFDYWCQLVKTEFETVQEVLHLEREFFTAATEIYKALLAWFRKLVKLEYFKARRIHLRDKMRKPHLGMRSGWQISAGDSAYTDRQHRTCTVYRNSVVRSRFA